jgi:uncharacterized protein
MSTSTRALLTNLFTSISSPSFRDAFLNAFSDNVTWTTTGTSPLAGRYERKYEYITKVLQPLHDQLESSPKHAVRRMTVDGEWAVVQFGSSGARGPNDVGFSMQYCGLCGWLRGRSRMSWGSTIRRRSVIYMLD